MTVVSNASPLVGLARIGRLDLLKKLYGQILVPEAVWDEVVIEGKGQPGAEEVSSAEWIRMHAIVNRQLAHGLSQDLGLGVPSFATPLLPWALDVEDSADR